MAVVNWLLTVFAADAALVWPFLNEALPPQLLVVAAVRAGIVSVLLIAFLKRLLHVVIGVDRGAADREERIPNVAGSLKQVPDRVAFGAVVGGWLFEQNRASLHPAARSWRGGAHQVDQ